MVDRQYFGDLALAVLLALPLAGLAQPQSIAGHHVAKPAALTAASADRSPEGRIGLLS